MKDSPLGRFNEGWLGFIPQWRRDAETGNKNVFALASVKVHFNSSTTGQ